MNVTGMEKKSRILCGDEFSGRRQLGKAGAAARVCSEVPWPRL